MILTILFYVLGSIVGFLAEFLPVFSVWPASLTDGIYYFGQQLKLLNFILPIYELSLLAMFVLSFLSYWFTAKIIVMIVNFFRGTGKIDV